MTFSRLLFSPRTAAAFLAFFAALGLAQAQAPQCSANAANVANLRLNGQAEAVGDVVVTCTGGTPTATGQTVPGFNFTLTSTVPITSRLLGGTWSEALLLVDEPPQASQLACTAPSGSCSVQGTGNGQGTYSGSTGRPNIFQAQQLSQNSITYPGVPFDPPGAGGSRIFRFTNVRVNPSSLASQAQVSISVSITGGTTINVSPSQIAVGATVTPVTVTQKGVQMGANGLAQFVLEFTESNASTFKTRSTAVDPSTSPAPANQNTPNQFFPGVETHFFNSALPFVSGRGSLGAAGLADNGTRLLASFTGLGQGVSLTTSTVINTAGGRLGAGLGAIRLITTNSSGVGPYQAAPSGTLLPDSNGNITAVFEVLQDDPNNIEQFDIPFTINYSNGAVGLHSISASAGLAPVSTVGGEDPTAPLPRFTSGLTTLQVSVLSISPTSISQGSVGAPYSQAFMATGGTGPYTWSATGLPSGLSMSTTGIINGTPTAPGTTLIVVGVTDATGSVNSIQLPLTIVNGFVITTTSVPNGTVGQPYTSQISSAGGQGTVMYSIGPPVLTTPSALPPGLFLNPNGSLTGTPLTAGTYSFTVDAQDQMGHQTSSNFKQTIAPALVITTVSPLATGAAGGGQLQLHYSGNGRNAALHLHGDRQAAAGPYANTQRTSGWKSDAGRDVHVYGYRDGRAGDRSDEAVPDHTDSRALPVAGVFQPTKFFGAVWRRFARAADSGGDVVEPDSGEFYGRTGQRDGRVGRAALAERADDARGDAGRSGGRGGSIQPGGGHCGRSNSADYSGRFHAASHCDWRSSGN